ncbi:TetR/AcrR family transcriptional regulator [Microbacterium sp. WCS2018Hpa-9]|uniref:TetR/AcrR family transcriptional regulator n=1 Tax=Microbacterium sp. WCS2018Hpa-9 TaxID=3073635 RepID=UPI00288BC703|nr:TetR/AcrR family transcriptional regulator [Microbacterium sp. WCS2018Hpa-9]
MTLSTGTYPKGVARRAEIVEAATRSFSRAGFDGTSILEIAGDVGISRAGLLHHFRSKEDLLLAVLAERERIDRAVFVESGSQEPGGLGVLRGMVRLARLNEGRPAMVRLFVVLSAEATEMSHPSHEYFREHFSRIIAGTSRALTQVRGVGLLRPGIDPESFARDLIALQEGLQLQWLMHPERVSIARPLEEWIQSVLLCPLWGDGG